jgi:cobalt-zinc-cadmium resistance protein CzcA
MKTNYIVFWGILIHLLLLSYPNYGQVKPQNPSMPLTLEQVLALALEQNGLIKGAMYQADYQKALKPTTTEIGKTNLAVQYGQYNSFVNDNNLTITQSLPFPTVFAKQKQLAVANIQYAEQQVATTQRELVKMVKNAYFTYLFVLEKQQLLRYQDSIYTEFLRAAELRYKTGETNQLEKALAQSQSLEVKNLLMQNQADQQIVATQLQTLLQSPQPIVLVEKRLKKLTFQPQIADTATLATHPLLQLLQQQIIVNQQITKVEKSRLLPDINVGFFSQTLVGYQRSFNGNNDIYFDYNKRFNGITLGLAFPLWAKPQNARIQAAKVQEKIAQNQYEYTQINLGSKYLQIVQEYTKLQNTLTYYEQNALPTADLLLSTAQKEFRSGNIDYIAHFQGLTRALTVKSAYYDVLNRYNQVVVELEFLVGK